MDSAVKEYRKRRAERLAEKKPARMDAVDEYRERRKNRLKVRLDAGQGWVFGALKSKGVDTKGMDLGEAFEKWNEINEGVSGKKAEKAEKTATGSSKKESEYKSSVIPRHKEGSKEDIKAREKSEKNRKKQLNNLGMEYRKMYETGEAITDDNIDSLDKGDVLTDGKKAYSVERIGGYRIGLRTIGNDSYGCVMEGPSAIKKLRKVDSGKTRYAEDYNVGDDIHKVKFPKPYPGSVYELDTLEEVRRLADKMNNGKAGLQKTVKSLTSDDIRYQKDPDGTVVASIPGLANIYDHEVAGKGPKVQAEYDRRIQEGKKITNDMMRISDSLGSRMVGLENCFKGGGSTARKIDKVKDKLSKEYGREVSDEEAFASMDDVVRYTYKCDHDNMAKQVTDLEAELEKNGYEITDRDNKFLPDYDDFGNEKPRNYKAVHLQVKSPTGEFFEVQIQSEPSLQVKNKNHRYFEEQRKIDLDEHPELADRHKELEKIMVDNTSKMKIPDGIMDLAPRGKSAVKAEKKKKKIEENRRRLSA